MLLSKRKNGLKKKVEKPHPAPPRQLIMKSMKPKPIRNKPKKNRTTQKKTSLKIPTKKPN
jgi:hypothetical protein